MNTAILYDSRTGNTEYLARAIAKAYPDAPMVTPDTCKEITAERVFVGFWTDKGVCSDALKAVLPKLEGKQVFLFGTAGFGMSNQYFEQIISRIQQKLPKSCEVIGWYMCAGRMGEQIKRSYEAMCARPETKQKGEMMLKNFALAAEHPNEEDVQALLERIKALS